MPSVPLRALAALSLALAPLTACDPVTTDGVEENVVEGAARRRESTRVRVATVEQREMVDTLETTTNLASERRVSILPRSTGELIELLAEEGDAVEAGDVLARLDPRDADVAWREAKVALTEAEQAVERAAVAIREAEARIHGSELAFANAKAVFERNDGQGLLSQQEVDSLRLDRDTAQSELEQARLALETARIDELTAKTNREKAQLEAERAELVLGYTEVRAPFAGTIAERSARLGDQLTSATEMFVLIDLDDLRAEFYRPQRELAMFTGRRSEDGDLTPPPLEVRLTAEAHPDETFSARLLRVSPDIDPESGSFRVTVDVEPVQQGVRLLPGMLVRLQVVTERHPDALVVSKRALRREGETTVVFVVRDDVAHRVEVRESFSDDESVEVVPREDGALAAGDRVVIVGNRDLEQGDPVQVMNPPAETQPEDDAPSEALTAGEDA